MWDVNGNSIQGSVESEGLDTVYLETTLNIIVQGVIPESIALVCLSFHQILLKEKAVPIPSCTHSQLVLTSHHILVVLPLAGELLLLGSHREEEVLVAAVPRG